MVNSNNKYNNKYVYYELENGDIVLLNNIICTYKYFYNNKILYKIYYENFNNAVDNVSEEDHNNIKKCLNIINKK